MNSDVSASVASPAALAPCYLLGAAAVPAAILLGRHLEALIVLVAVAAVGLGLVLRRRDRYPGLAALLLLVAVLSAALATALLVPAGVPWPVPLAVAQLMFLITMGAGVVRWDDRWRRLNRVPVVLWPKIALVVPASAVGLVAWFAWASPDPAGYVALLDRFHPVVLVAAGLAFVLVNAVAEELTFNGVVQSALRERFGATVSGVLSAALFGLAHFHGFPSGWVGVVLAAAYGLVLAYLRGASGGLTAPIIAHVLADVTIVTIVVTAA